MAGIIEPVVGANLLAGAAVGLTLGALKLSGWAVKGLFGAGYFMMRAQGNVYSRVAWWGLDKAKRVGLIGTNAVGRVALKTFDNARELGWWGIKKFGTGAKYVGIEGSMITYRVGQKVYVISENWFTRSRASNLLIMYVLPSNYWMKHPKGSINDAESTIEYDTEIGIYPAINLAYLLARENNATIAIDKESSDLNSEYVKTVDAGDDGTASNELPALVTVSTFQIGEQENVSNALVMYPDSTLADLDFDKLFGLIPKLVDNTWVKPLSGANYNNSKQFKMYYTLDSYGSSRGFQSVTKTLKYVGHTPSDCLKTKFKSYNAQSNHDIAVYHTSYEVTKGTFYGGSAEIGLNTAQQVPTVADCEQLWTGIFGTLTTLNISNQVKNKHKFTDKELASVVLNQSAGKLTLRKKYPYMGGVSQSKYITLSPHRENTPTEMFRSKYRSAQSEADFILDSSNNNNNRRFYVSFPSTSQILIHEMSQGPTNFAGIKNVYLLVRPNFHDVRNMLQADQLSTVVQNPCYNADLHKNDRPAKLGGHHKQHIGESLIASRQSTVVPKAVLDGLRQHLTLEMDHAMARNNQSHLEHCAGKNIAHPLMASYLSNPTACQSSPFIEAFHDNMIKASIEQTCKSLLNYPGPNGIGARHQQHSWELDNISGSMLKRLRSTVGKGANMVKNFAQKKATQAKGFMQDVQTAKQARLAATRGPTKLEPTALPTLQAPAVGGSKGHTKVGNLLTSISELERDKAALRMREQQQQSELAERRVNYERKLSLVNKAVNKNYPLDQSQPNANLTHNQGKMVQQLTTMMDNLDLQELSHMQVLPTIIGGVNKSKTAMSIFENPPSAETLRQRKKQIALVKSDISYIRYAAEIRKQDRIRGAKDYPVTPRAKESISVHNFNGNLRAWRKAVEEWTPDKKSKNYNKYKEMAEAADAKWWQDFSEPVVRRYPPTAL